MNILITGSNGFIAKNLIVTLDNLKYNLLPITRETSNEELHNQLKKADFIVHLAGINRPQKEDDYLQNRNFTKEITTFLNLENRKLPIIYTSSIQVEKDNAYGNSKLQAEKVLEDYSESTGATVFIYRLPNVFGKWCRPNYNSVIATFCNNISKNIPIIINDRNSEITLVYIDHVINDFLYKIKNIEDYTGINFPSVSPTFSTTVGDVADIIFSFKESRINKEVPIGNNPLKKYLYSTYLSFLDEEDFSYKLLTHSDDRGSFTEFLKTENKGQISVNISKPGITKGNHWHHTKVEKFLIVSGEGLIQFRKIDSNNIIEYKLTGQDMTVVDIPVGYTHNIINTGKEDLITIMWANEMFNPENPDTFYEEV